MATLLVRVLAVNVECTACGDAQRIDQPQCEDSFTQKILEPLYAWWMAHLLPQMVEIEATTEWDAEEAGDGVDG